MKKINLKTEAKNYKKDLAEKMKNRKYKLVYDAELRILSLAREVEKIRKEKHISQTKIADRLNIEQQQISRFEQGKQNATLTSFLKILEVLDKDIKIVDKKPGKTSGSRKKVFV